MIAVLYGINIEKDSFRNIQKLYVILFDKVYRSITSNVPQIGHLWPIVFRYFSSM